MKKAGVLILALGALITVFTAFNFTFNTKENIVDTGTFQINQRTRHSLAWSPITGVAVMVAGGIVYLFGLKKQSVV